MRLQIQQARAGTTFNTYGLPLYAPDPGVGVRTVQAAMAGMYTGAELLGSSGG